MAILKAKVPKNSTIGVEIDTTQRGIIIVDDAELLIDGRVTQLIANLIEENTALMEQIDYYESFLGGVVHV